MQDIQLPYGIKNGQLVHISEVESGIACGCVCPSCNAQLVARKGEKVIHHFAHHSTTPCEDALETALHLAAKDVFNEQKRITLPPVKLYVNSQCHPIILADSKVVTIDTVHMEKKLGNIVPDLILETGGRKLLVEVFVTHAVDDQKLEKIKTMGISAIEIDLSSAPRDIPKDVLTILIVNKYGNLKWLNNERANNAYKEIFENSVLKEVIHGWNSIVERCPEKMQKWNGRYARKAHFNECFWCKYCLEQSYEHIRCVGHMPDIVNKYIV